MAYLRWSSSPWHAYRHADGGEGDAALFVAWHVSFTGFNVTARQLRQAGCEGQPDRLRQFMEGVPNLDPLALGAAESLSPAVDQFLFEALNAGRIPMPAQVASRYKRLKRLVEEEVNRPRQEDRTGAARSRQTQQLMDWMQEIQDIDRRHPPPPLPSEVRTLMDARGMRALAGEMVSALQDADERARIDAALNAWPP